MSQVSKMIQPVMQGKWGESSWGFFLASALPDRAFCTSVACVAIRDIATREVVLTYTPERPGKKQGQWELPGGHIDPVDPKDPTSAREDIQTALAREALEEGGYRVDEAQLFGYRLVRNKPPSRLANPAPGKMYPAEAFMPYYWATTAHPLEKPTDPSEPACGSFSVDAAEALERAGAMDLAELTILRYGVAAALQYMEHRDGC